jgi:phosphatidylglycerophosphate synthase
MARGEVKTRRAPTLKPTAPGTIAQRRPIATRERGWAKALARTLSVARITPDAISLTSVAFAIAAGVLLWLSGTGDGVARALELLGAAALIQLRLLCNMLDGMVAVEGNRRTPHGELFNDLPDRIADLAILVGAGYSLSAFAFGRELGWLAGVAAILTAYVRVLGGSMGARQSFTGPMAKPHRMAVMTVACVLSILEPLLHWRGQIIAAALLVVVVGSVITLVRRTVRIIADVDGT